MTDTFDVGAVLLDMDGTLVDSTAVVERVWTAWAHEHGLDPAAVLAVCHGRQGHETMAELLPDRPREVNVAENDALLKVETTDLDGVVAIPGAPEFLGALHDVRHALVTSADTGLATARMGAAGMALPELSITAEKVTRSKPDPEGFLAAAAALHADPADCLVFEDSPAGIAAAHAAGMPAVAVGPHATDLPAERHIDDYLGVRVTALPDGRALILIPT